MRTILPLAALPLIEIALFVLVGGWIGLWPTLALVVAAAAGGVMVLRRQGQSILRALAAGPRMARGADLAEGGLVVLAGVLLVLPGFLTDMVALVLLVPAARQAIAVRLAAQAGPVPGGSDAVIEGEWTELADPPAGAPRRGWARPGAED